MTKTQHVLLFFSQCVADLLMVPAVALIVLWLLLAA